MRLIATTVVRESIRGKQKTGFVYDIDWASRQVVRRFPVPEPRYPESDDNPRGGVRGGRGVAVTRHGIVVANYDTLYRYDDDWNVLDAFSHPLFVGIHETDWDGEHLWLSATGIDAVLKVTLNGEAAVAWDPYGSSLATRVRLRKRPNPIDGSVDYRKREAPLIDHFHINGVTRRGSSLVVNCGLVRTRSPLPIRLASRVLSKLAGGQVLRRTRGGSLVVRVEGDGVIDVLAELADHDFATHNGQLLDDFRLVLNDSSVNSVRIFELTSGGKHRSVRVPGTWLRGLERIDRRRILVGTAPATIVLVDLDREAIEASVQLSSNPNEAIHGLALCPPAGSRL
jgi:hypothetical protein